VRGDLAKAVNCNYVAATVLCDQNRVLASARLERNLRSIANRLGPCDAARSGTPRQRNGKQVCLHVMREALPAGGLTSMAVRWMQNDRRGRVHSVVLLTQKTPLPDALLNAVNATGGSIYKANATDSFLQQALWLRSLAHQVADYVILHIHNSDVVCAVAFGKKGGPPVLLVNHSAHAFWVGASIADLVLNCRGSALEGFWTAKLRGGLRHAILPIPLVLLDSGSVDSSSEQELKRQAKISIGLPADAVVLLTVGAAFKYQAMEDLDFVIACERILSCLPHAYALAVGVSGDDRWRSASRR